MRTLKGCKSLELLAPFLEEAGKSLELLENRENSRTKRHFGKPLFKSNEVSCVSKGA
jgi:hypothetical protein